MCIALHANKTYAKTYTVLARKARAQQQKCCRCNTHIRERWITLRSSCARPLRSLRESRRCFGTKAHGTWSPAKDETGRANHCSSLAVQPAPPILQHYQTIFDAFLSPFEIWHQTRSRRSFPAEASQRGSQIGGPATFRKLCIFYKICHVSPYLFSDLMCKSFSSLEYSTRSCGSRFLAVSSCLLSHQIRRF